MSAAETGVGAGARIFVRHADPAMDPERPTATWPLSAAGRARAAALAPVVLAWRPGRVWSSPEPRARETAEAIAGAEIDVDIVDDLREHERSEVPWYDDPTDFVAAVAGLFREPSRRVFGDESAVEAERRFADAVESAAARTSGGPPVFVAHGTVMSLYLGRILERDPFQLWQEMDFGALAVVAWPDPRLRLWRPGG